MTAWRDWWPGQNFTASKASSIITTIVEARSKVQQGVPGGGQSLGQRVLVVVFNVINNFNFINDTSQSLADYFKSCIQSFKNLKYNDMMISLSHIWR